MNSPSGRPWRALPGGFGAVIVLLGLVQPSWGWAAQEIPPGLGSREMVEAEALPAMIAAVEYILLGSTDVERRRANSAAPYAHAHALEARKDLNGSVVVSAYEGWRSLFSRFYPHLDGMLHEVTESLAEGLRSRGHPVTGGAMEVQRGPLPSGLHPELSRELGRTFHGRPEGRVLAECRGTWDGVISSGRECIMGEGVTVLIEVSYPFPVGEPRFDIPVRWAYVTDDGSVRRASAVFRMVHRSGTWVMYDIFPPINRDQD